MHHCQRFFSFSLIAAILVAAVPFHSAQAAQEQVQAAAVFAQARSGELLIKYKGQKTLRLQRFPSNTEAYKAMKKIAAHPDIESVQPNFYYHTAAISNDPLLGSQPYLETIEAYTAWDTGANSKDVVIAVVDSGVDIEHPDLRASVWTNPGETLDGLDNDGNGYVDDIHGWDFLQDTNDVMPKAPTGVPENAIGVQHGTGVAGIISATGNNGVGIAGVAWRSQIMSLRVLNEYGVGDSEVVTRALQYAIDAGADIINLSLVGTDIDPIAMDLLQQAYEKGIIVVAAAGNVGINLNNSPTYPVCYDGNGPATVIGVGAIDLDYSRPSFSNYGDTCVDIVAPGVKVFTTRHVKPSFVVKDQYASLFSGTSFAAPQVTGVIALMKQRYPELTSEQALYLLQQGATRIGEIHAAGSGFTYALNAAGSLALLENGDFDTQLPVPEPDPDTSVLPQEFLAFPRGTWDPTAYQYQLPGPILVSPVVLHEDALRSGMRFSKESETRYIVTAWKANSKKVWRFNTLTKQMAELFVVDLASPQTAGHTAVGNVDSDNEPEVIVAAAPGSLPYVSVYTLKGQLKFQFMAFEEHIKGGLDVAVVDTNGDGFKEIAVVPSTQTAGEVRLFDYTGLRLGSFLAYGKNFNGGATLRSADIDGDSIDELLLAPGIGGGPHIRVYQPDGTLKLEFFAGEVNEAGGAIAKYMDIDGDRKEEYVISYHSGHDAVIRLYDPQGQFKAEWGVFDTKYKGGVDIIAL